MALEGKLWGWPKGQFTRASHNQPHPSGPSGERKLCTSISGLSLATIVGIAGDDLLPAHRSRCCRLAQSAGCSWLNTLYSPSGVLRWRSYCNCVLAISVIIAKSRIVRGPSRYYVESVGESCVQSWNKRPRCAVWRGPCCLVVLYLLILSVSFSRSGECSLTVPRSWFHGHRAHDS